MRNRIQTKRLTLRPYVASDGDAVWEVVRRPEIYPTTTSIPKDYPRSRVDWWFSFQMSARQHGTGYEYGLFDRETGAYIGHTGLCNVRKDQRSAVLTYFIHPELWGRGYASEAGEAMLALGFGALELMRIGGSCMAKNPASRRVLLKLGMQYEGTGRRELCKDGEYLDVEHFSILFPEWQEQRGME